MKNRTQKIIKALWSAAGSRQVYAILDAARSERIYNSLTRFGGEYLCLYKDRIPEVLARAAPYLVRLEPHTSFTRWLIDNGWGESWGIFCSSRREIFSLVSHLRQFILVEDEEGNNLYFRFYDPRVMRIYLPTCNEIELMQLFHTVITYFMENVDGSAVYTYSFSGRTLKEGRISIMDNT